MKKLTISFLIISLFNYLACTTFNVASKETIKEEVKNGTYSEIYIITMDNNRYHFGGCCYYIKNDTLYGKGLKINPNGEEPFKGKIAMGNISHFEVEEIDVVDKPGILILMTVLIVSVIYIISDFLKWKKK